MHVLEPFLPDLLITPDHNTNDIDAEIKALFVVQRMIEGFLKGTVSIDDLNQCMYEFGIDPNEYWGTVEDCVDAVVNSGQALDDVDLILLGTDGGDPLCLSY
jgi:hypothetical protein